MRRGKISGGEGSQRFKQVRGFQVFIGDDRKQKFQRSTLLHLRRIFNNVAINAGVFLSQ